MSSPETTIGEKRHAKRVGFVSTVEPVTLLFFKCGIGMSTPIGSLSSNFGPNHKEYDCMTIDRVRHPRVDNLLDSNG